MHLSRQPSKLIEDASVITEPMENLQDLRIILWQVYSVVVTSVLTIDSSLLKGSSPSSLNALGPFSLFSGFLMKGRLNLVVVFSC